MQIQNASHVHQIVTNAQIRQHVRFAHWIISLILKVIVQWSLQFVKVDCLSSMGSVLIFVLLDILLILSQVSVKFVLKIADNVQAQLYAQFVFLH